MDRDREPEVSEANDDIEEQEEVDFDVLSLLSRKPSEKPAVTFVSLDEDEDRPPPRSYRVQRVDEDEDKPQGGGKPPISDGGEGKPPEDGGSSVRGEEQRQEGRLRFNPNRIGRLERVERPLPPTNGEQFARKSLPDYDENTREASHPYNVPGLEDLANGASGKITHTNWDGSKVEATVTRGEGKQVIEYDQPAQVTFINGGKETGYCVPIIDAKRIETTVDADGKMTTVITNARGDQFIQTHDEKGAPSAIQDKETGTVHEGLRGKVQPSVVYRSS